MRFSLIPKIEIEKSKLNEQIVKETALQVIKDFALFGMEISFPDDIHMAYDELFNQLTIFVESLMKRDPEKLSALLYQIDLDEKQMKNATIEPFHEHEWISDMILEREFMKVLTRNYFKNQNP
jgi:hypothetical protein